MTLKDTIQADALSVFTNVDEFAESVVYVKRSGAMRTINAVVFREATASSDQSGGVSVPFFEVHVANNAASGISSTEIDLGGDKICMDVRNGKCESNRAITAIMMQDEGMLVLQCQ